jgi:hypothetical protein
MNDSPVAEAQPPPPVIPFDTSAATAARSKNTDPADYCLGMHILPYLGGGSQSPSRPGQYNARCPAHDDRKASLSIATCDRRRIIWHCHRDPVGCTDASVRSAIAVNGRRRSDARRTVVNRRLTLH